MISPALCYHQEHCIKQHIITKSGDIGGSVEPPSDSIVHPALLPLSSLPTSPEHCQIFNLQSLESDPNHPETYPATLTLDTKLWTISNQEEDTSTFFLDTLTMKVTHDQLH